MAKRLTKKQKGFVKDYVATGNATEAAERNYDVKDRHVANAVGNENLAKPIIVNAIAEALPNELLAERHLELLNKRDALHFKNEDGTVETIDLGPEVQAVSKGLDMAYKLRGDYAPEKKVTLNLDAKLTERERELASKLLHR